MYINLWYVAAFSAEVTRQPLKVRMLTRDFVLFRDLNANVACLSNVCPHRGVSLAQGRCMDDGTLECPQHGWRFGVAGECRLIPSRPADAPIPVRARVDAYLTHEANGLVWVFLGDDVAAAPPIPPMPECDLPGWRTISHGETWNCNVHWAKFSNIDLTHVPIAHGQKFLGCFSPKEHITRPDEFSVASSVVTPFEQPRGSWQGVREVQRNIASTLSFCASGFMMKGHLEIGGEGSGIFVTFYEMSTPIDAQTTAMRYLFVRNFMAEPAHDASYLERNLKNLREDRALAETQLPRFGPDIPTERDLLLDPDDTVAAVYWQIMGSLRGRGWQIDGEALAVADRSARYCTIPSPVRRKQPGEWVHERIPTCPANTNERTSVSRPSI
jgi:phenylpropionate dioxygenase-like ring-hydroxylating dioxygenase large terminal subunit